MCLRLEGPPVSHSIDTAPMPCCSTSSQSEISERPAQPDNHPASIKITQCLGKNLRTRNSVFSQCFLYLLLDGDEADCRRYAICITLRCVSGLDLQNKSTCDGTHEHGAS